MRFIFSGKMLVLQSMNFMQADEFVHNTFKN